MIASTTATRYKISNPVEKGRNYDRTISLPRHLPSANEWACHARIALRGARERQSSITHSCRYSQLVLVLQMLSIRIRIESGSIVWQHPQFG